MAKKEKTNLFLGSFNKKDFLDQASKIFVAPSEKLDIEFIIPAPYNPRKISPEELNKIKTSITTFGYLGDLIVNKRTRHVVGGNQRLSVLKDLGFKELECKIVDVDLQSEMALNIALNKLGGEFDTDKLALVFAELENANDSEFSPDFLNSLTGFSSDEIEDIMSINTEAEAFDFENEEDEESDNEKADLIDGSNQINNSVQENYIIINFDNLEQYQKAKEQLGLKNLERTVNWNILKESFKEV